MTTALTPFDSSDKSVSLVDWSNYQGETGMENVTQSDLGIPFLNVVQKGSAEFDEAHKDHATKRIEGVKVGSIINTATRSIVYQPRGAAIYVIPTFFVKTWVEWKLKNQGGGIAKVHRNVDVLRRTQKNDKGTDIIIEGEGSGNEVKPTNTFYVLYHHDGSWHQAIINLTATGLGVARQWLNKAQLHRRPDGQPLPLFSQAYSLSTILCSNTRGSWSQMEITHAGPVRQPEVIEAAMAMCKEATRLNTSLSTSVAPDTTSSVSDGENL